MGHRKSQKITDNCRHREDRKNLINQRIMCIYRHFSQYLFFAFLVSKSLGSCLGPAICPLSPVVHSSFNPRDSGQEALNSGKRIVMDTERFVVLQPFASRFPLFAGLPLIGKYRPEGDEVRALPALREAI
jgi:hypothetical protein